MATLTKRRFKFVGGSSDKFWRSRPTATRSSFDSVATGPRARTPGRPSRIHPLLRSTSNKLVKEKLGKGYLEVK